jgi:uncharacterized protein
VLSVTGLYVYPVKGARGISLDTAVLDEFGVSHDRRWMIVDAAGEFITQRNHPTLALLTTALEADALVLRSPRAGEVSLPLAVDHGESRTVRIWDDVVEVLDAGATAAAFVSRHLDVDARLLYMPDVCLRQADPAYAAPGDRVSFADGFPLLLITQASLDELNRRLPEPVPMARFRPNLVVSGAAPHDEDRWRSVRTAGVRLDVVKPCARCAVTTIDPATGVAGREPLRTLAGYRRRDGRTWFGQNVLHRGEGELRLGAEVEVLTAGPARPDLEL